MLHWFPSPTVAFAGARASESAIAFPGEPSTFSSARGRHALMLAYAAQRRRAASAPSDSRYWKAAAPVALDKARALRLVEGLPTLP